MTNQNTRPRALAAGLLGAALLVGGLAGVAFDRLVLLPRGAIAAEAAPPETANQRGPGDSDRRGPPRSDDRYLEFLTREIGLTQEQRAQIEQILQDQQDRVVAITRETRPQMRAVAEETRKSIDAVLTQEQLDKLAEFRARRDRQREAAGERGRGESHGESPRAPAP